MSGLSSTDAQSFESALIAAIRATGGGQPEMAANILKRLAETHAAAADVVHLVYGILLNPSAGRPMFQTMAISLATQGFPMAAADVFRLLGARAGSPNEMYESQMGLVRCLVGADRAHEAEPIFRRLRRLDPDVARAHADINREVNRARDARRASCPANLLLAERDSEQFSALAKPEIFPSMNAHPLTGAFGRVHYRAFYGERLEDTSLIVLHDGKPTLFAECSATLTGPIRTSSHPLILHPARGCDPGLFAQAAEAAIAHLRAEARAIGAPGVQIYDAAGQEYASPVGLAALRHGGQMETHFVGVIDLTREERDIWLDVRKSYRPLVNWGKREMTLRRFGARGSDPTILNEFFELHARKWNPYPPESQALLRDLLTSGRGEATVASLPDLGDVATTLTIDDGHTAIYFAGHYFPSAEGLAVSHWPLWDHVLGAKARGCKLFELGFVYEHITPTDDPKHQQIGFFKRGFTADIRQKPFWMLPAASDSPEG